MTQCILPQNDNHGCFRISIYDGRDFSDAEECLIREIPLEVCFNDRKVITIACVGAYIDELAVGFLRSEGIIGNKKDIAAVEISPDRMRVNIRSSAETVNPLRDAERTLLSSGAFGFRGSEKARVTRLAKSASLSPETILGLMERALDQACLHKKTGGTHAAALVRDGEILVVREDIGRHNAIDMLSGYALLNELDCRETAVFRTGRVSSELVDKVRLIGSPLICSLSVPTMRAVETAMEAGISLIGSVRRGRLKIYT